MNNKKLLVGITGLAATGKTTAGEYLRDKLELYHLTFAEPVIHLCAAATRETDYEFMNRDKNKTIFTLGATPRELMQQMGKFLRNMNPNYIIHCLERSIKNYESNQFLFNGIIVSDVRIPLEADWLRKNGGVLIHVTNPSAPPVTPDYTEQVLEIREQDYSAENTSSLEDFYNKLDQIADDILVAHLGKAAA